MNKETDSLKLIKPSSWPVYILLTLAIILTAIPHRYFDTNQYVMGAVNYLRSYPHVDAAHKRIDWQTPGFANKYIFSYIMMALVGLLTTCIYSARAFMASIRGKEIFSTEYFMAVSGRPAMRAFVGGSCLILLQLFWIDKFSRGTTAIIVIDAPVWTGVIYFWVIFF